VKKIASLIIVIFLLVHTGIAQHVYLTHSGLASFVSEAPLEVIRAESGEVSGAINLAERTFAFSIDNKSFKGFNSPLQQEHFYENYMEAQQYPTSSFKGKIIEEIGLNPGQEQTVRAKGMFETHGVSQERIIKGTIKISDDKIQVHADFTVLLEDHGIKIPRVVYQKIAEEIKISVSAELIRKTE